MDENRPNEPKRSAKLVAAAVVIFLIVGLLSFLFGYWFHRRALFAPPVKGIPEAYEQIAHWAALVGWIAFFLAACAVALWRDIVNRDKNSQG
jgi:H+/Cl- antiporter ClcA